MRRAVYIVWTTAVVAVLAALVAAAFDAPPCVWCAPAGFRP